MQQSAPGSEDRAAIDRRCFLSLALLAMLAPRASRLRPQRDGVVITEDGWILSSEDIERAA